MTTAVEVEEIVLVDLSSIAHAIWHMSTSEPDPDYTSIHTAERVHRLTVNHPKAAICCDSGRSFRHDISAAYKANRPEREAALHHQIELAKDRLKADGYPVWSVKGFEADDIIATATQACLGLADTNVLIMSADKDLLQLVGPRVRMFNTKANTVFESEDVKAKFGVWPNQMVDYLSLVGDKSDNIKGASGIGEKKAAELLGKYTDLVGIFHNLREHATQFTPGLSRSLREFQPRASEVRSLITLRTDVELPLGELDNPREPKEAEPMADEKIYDAMLTMADAAAAINKLAEPVAAVEPALTTQVPAPAPAVVVPEPPQGATAATAALVPMTPDVLAPAPEDWGKQLEPRSLVQAKELATAMYNARLFNGYGSPPAVLSTILAGRELGMNAVASLRAFHIVEGRHALAADALRALVMKSGLASYFRPTARTAERATFVTHRKGDPEPISLTYTIEEATAAGMVKKGSSWEKNPADMLVARASSKLARLVYPDVCFGLYSPEELS